MMSAAVNDRPIVLFSDGQATRSFCYISDFVAGMLLVLVLGAPGEAYNVGNDEEVSIASAAKLMAEASGSPNVRVEYRKSADQEYTVDNPQRSCPKLEKITSATGWRPLISLKDGLRRTLTSYREEDARASA